MNALTEFHPGNYIFYGQFSFTRDIFISDHVKNNNIFYCIAKEEFEDTKGVIRIRISKKNRQHNGQKKKYKRTNNDL